ncbi:Rad33-domain-containing protein [Scheffersomyces xylosifermentans]|uniref:Rad33-domain-containing protein n=1 Tax=Scheffersomyces xylosifermentans TaxID=1304137 RepID=UPI00315D7F88
MARGRKSTEFKKSSEYEVVSPQIEDEILEVYTELAGDEDLYLSQLPELFGILKIPECFTQDIKDCIEYYYDFIRPNADVKFDATNVKQYTTLNLINSYSLTSNITKIHEVIDIVDIDKLIRNLNRLIKFRNNYKHIFQSWELFVAAATTEEAGISIDKSESFVLNYKLSLPDLKHIKNALNLDHESQGKHSLGDSFLIDMLSCCTTNSRGDILNFDFNKPKTGLCVSIKDFAEILGNLGELE